MNLSDLEEHRPDAIFTAHEHVSPKRPNCFAVGEKRVTLVLRALVVGDVEVLRHRRPVLTPPVLVGKVANPHIGCELRQSPEAATSFRAAEAAEAVLCKTPQGTSDSLTRLRESVSARYSAFPGRYPSSSCQQTGRYGAGTPDQLELRSFARSTTSTFSSLLNSCSRCASRDRGTAAPPRLLLELNCMPDVDAGAGAGASTGVGVGARVGAGELLDRLGPLQCAITGGAGAAALSVGGAAELIAADDARPPPTREEGGAVSGG